MPGIWCRQKHRPTKTVDLSGKLRRRHNDTTMRLCLDGNALGAKPMPARLSGRAAHLSPESARSATSHGMAQLRNHVISDKCKERPIEVPIAGVLLFLAFIDRGRIVCAKKPSRLGPSKILLHKGTGAAQPVAESWHNPSCGALGIAPLSPELDPAAAGFFVGEILNPQFLSATIIEPQEPWMRVSDTGTLRFGKQLVQRAT